jgi:hypothetical protein
MFELSVQVMSRIVVIRVFFSSTVILTVNGHFCVVPQFSSVTDMDTWDGDVVPATNT